MPRAKKTEDTPRPRRRPATTPEARENQMIALAVDLAEEQLREGTASAQVITHYLKLGTTRETLEKEYIQRRSELLAEQKEAIASGKRVEELYKDALNAMKSYSGASMENVELLDD